MEKKNKRRIPQYITARLKTSESHLRSAIKWTLGGKAEEAEYKIWYDKVMEPLDIKSMPKFYKRMMSYMFDYMWKDQIQDQIMYTWEWKGKIWGNLDKIPKEARALIVTNKLKMKRPVFIRDMVEGMPVDYEVKR